MVASLRGYKWIWEKAAKTAGNINRSEEDEESSSAKPAGLKTKMKGKDQFLERRKWQPQSYLSQSHRAAVLPGGCRRLSIGCWQSQEGGSMWHELQRG